MQHEVTSYRRVGAWAIVGAVLSAGVWLVPRPVPAQPAAAQTKPNIVYILSDDQGWKDVGYHGSDIKTPNIDALAAGGARLEQFYAQPMCTPTRAALMTGRYPFRYGLQTLVVPSGFTTYGLPTDEWLLPQALREAGYKAAIVGKWHLGHGEHKYWPRQRGFDFQYGPLLGEIDYFTHEQHGVLDWYRNGKLLKEKGYSTTLLGDQAVKLINAQPVTQPLLLYLTFNAPHTPYEAPQQYLDQYKNIADPSRRAYAGSITAMDDQIGRVVEALDQKKMRDNTIIVFQSDNGGTRNAMFSGEMDMSKIKIPCDNGPYREGKGTLYEGGTRVPALVNWQGHVKGGSVVNGMMHEVDMYPTLIALAGGSTAKAKKPLDGINMWPTISEGRPSPRTELIYNIEIFRAGVREGDWKLVWRVPLPQSVELYNIAQDPSEKNNLAAENPQKVASLQKRANELAATMAPSPLLQAAFKSLRAQLTLPPAFPNEPLNEELDFNQEP